VDDGGSIVSVPTTKQTFGEKNRDEETQRDAGDGEHEEEEKEQGSIGVLQDG